jgi:hypothetical protein
VPAIDDLLAAAAELDSVRLALATQLGRRIRPIEAAALGTLLADVVATAQYQLPVAVREELTRVDEEIETIPLEHLRTALLQNPPTEAEDAVVRFLVEYERLRREAGFDEGPRARLVLAFKSTYFLVRALQDGLYRVVFELVQGARPPAGPNASMRRAADNEHDPVRVAIGAFGCDYFVWFAGWRSFRNSIKYGRPAGIVGPASPSDDKEDIGINFASVSDEGALHVDLSRATRVSDVTRAITTTTALCRVIEAILRTGTAD